MQNQPGLAAAKRKQEKEEAKKRKAAGEEDEEENEEDEQDPNELFPPDAEELDGNWEGDDVQEPPAKRSKN